MKYSNFKIFKFSTISKKINHKLDRFSTIHKNIKTIPGYIVNFIVKNIFSGINKSIKFILNEISGIYKLIDIRRLDFKKVYKYLDIRRYDFYRIDKKINFKNYKNLPIYFLGFIIFIGFIYVAIPMFYNYDKSKMEKAICKNKNIECLIKGEINYSFYPTPRIKIKDLSINDVFQKKNTLATVKDAAVKLSFGNLLTKAKHNFKKIELSNFEIIDNYFFKFMFFFS